jgi:hypothetical protein
MASHIITKPYKTQYSNPITLKAGEVVTLGQEETEEKWKGWIWAETANDKGWIPIQIVNFIEGRTKGIITASYTAKELDVEAGDEVVKIKSLNGWSWVRNLKNNEEGWIPDEMIK